MHPTESNFSLRFFPYSNSAILIEWPEEISEAILQDIRAFKCEIDEQQPCESVMAYRSLLLIYKKKIDFKETVKTLKKIYQSREFLNIKPKQWKIPVLYNNKVGWDLEAFCTQKKLSPTDLIRLHTSAVYRVFAIGFLPGFMYLGGLDQKLWTPRHSKPRAKVPKGSVGIGGQQTGVYPQESPGGWHLIGNAPVQLFDAHRKKPCPISVGDTVRFSSISEEEHELINIQVKSGIFQMKNLLEHA
ncbi:MAG: 5-oxoprolinase subunit PxpB [Bacteroidetes bacterium]|nr:5-oxoprolinase subunit PxpB [Bacteroidota bacterium]